MIALGMGDLLDLLDETMKEKLGLERLLFHACIKVPYHGIKKNRREIHLNRRTGQRFIGKSKRLVSAENYLLQQLLVHKARYKIDFPFRCAMSCMFIFKYRDFHAKNGAISRHVADLSNLFELPADSLQKAGIIYDDRLIHSFDFSRRMPGEEDELEIFIREFRE